MWSGKCGDGVLSNIYTLMRGSGEEEVQIGEAERMISKLEWQPGAGDSKAKAGEDDCHI